MAERDCDGCGFVYACRRGAHLGRQNLLSRRLAWFTTAAVVVVVAALAHASNAPTADEPAVGMRGVDFVMMVTLVGLVTKAVWEMLKRRDERATPTDQSTITILQGQQAAIQSVNQGMGNMVEAVSRISDAMARMTEQEEQDGRERREVREYIRSMNHDMRDILQGMVARDAARDAVSSQTQGLMVSTLQRIVESQAALSERLAVLTTSRREGYSG